MAVGAWPTRMFQTDSLSRLELIKFECLQLADSGQLGESKSSYKIDPNRRFRKYRL